MKVGPSKIFYPTIVKLQNEIKTKIHSMKDFGFFFSDDFQDMLKAEILNRQSEQGLQNSIHLTVPQIIISNLVAEFYEPFLCFLEKQYELFCWYWKNQFEEKFIEYPRLSSYLTDVVFHYYFELKQELKLLIDEQIFEIDPSCKTMNDQYNETIYDLKFLFSFDLLKLQANE